jgi:thiamine-monophosphate kinase
LPGEFELIAQLCDGLQPGRHTILGVGDDCAVLASSRRPILFTVDSMVEGVHFDLQWGHLDALGAKSLAVNLSDIAAMGGRPTGCVVNLAIRDGITPVMLDRIYAGLRQAARESGAEIVGGNITRARELSITIAVLGEAGSGIMRRDTARPGDEIFVTGMLGDATLGWRILAGEVKAASKVARHLVNRFFRPEPRLFAGQRLAAIRPTPAGIDISDGLMQDLGHILERSGVGAEVEAATIPRSPAYRALMGDDLSHALSGGEDYELLFCLRPGHSEAQLKRRLQVPVQRIGRIVRGSRAKLIGPGDFAESMSGWDHFRNGRRQRQVAKSKQ